MLAAVLSGCGDEGTTIVNSETTTAAGITVAGTGIVYGTPDVVTLRLGASVIASSVAQAREQAAVSIQTVINSLKANGVADKDIQTTGLSISPQYDFSGRTQTLRGYQVSNLVTAKIRKIDSAGKSIDDATAAGGNDVVVQGI
ncbi:MAG: SIMPL domain-containing protein, partial [Vicinamibacterales bacterium]